MDHIPSEKSVRSLHEFLKGLINEIDNEIDNVLDSESEPIQLHNTYNATEYQNKDCVEHQFVDGAECEPAAFEEISQIASPAELSTLFSRSGVWVSNSDSTGQLNYVSNLERLQKLATYFQEDSSNTDGLEISNKSPADQSNYNVSLSDISSEFQDHNGTNLPYSMEPFYLMQGSPFHLFNYTHLDQATSFTHFFAKSRRSAVYYGEHPYSYGGVYHVPKPISENKYLQKILSYLEVVIPGVSYNSAMIHKYESGDAFIPHHADDEEEIVESSEIITISLGESRVIEFKQASSGSTSSQKLNHGDVFVMNKLTQGLYTHSITEDCNSDSLGPRLSITVRLIKPPTPVKTNTLDVSNISSEHLPSSLSTITNFLNDLENEDNVDNENSNLVELTTETALEFNATANHSEVLQQDVNNNKRNEYSNGPTLHQPLQKSNTLYISSSMYRFLDSARLSSKNQTAYKLFYPGANASQMHIRLKNDPQFVSLDKKSITKIMLLTGTNNVDSIYFGDPTISLNSTEADISGLIGYLQDVFPSAKLNIVNILPRKAKGRMDIINLLNNHIRAFCTQSANLQYIDTYSNNMFAHRDGNQRKEFFKLGGKFGNDDCHLNAQGVVRLGKHLKFVAHQ